MDWKRTSEGTWRKGDWVIHTDRLDGVMSIYSEGKHVRDMNTGREPSPDFDKLLAEAKAYCDKQDRPRVNVYARARQILGRA